MGGLVISGGRVVDPASGMDAVGDVRRLAQSPEGGQLAESLLVLVGLADAKQFGVGRSR